MDDIKAFLSDRSPVYVQLVQLREDVGFIRQLIKFIKSFYYSHFPHFQAWKNPCGDEDFQQKQNIADNATPGMKIIFFQTHLNIAKEMNDATQLITDISKSDQRATPPKVLDLCMAPGGFSEQVLKTLGPRTVINGITLPVSLGGIDLVLENNSSVNVEFLDITMLAAEMGFKETDIPLNHPEKNLFCFDRPFSNQMYDLIFCGGQVQRTQKLPEYREKTEHSRLKVSQLVFALQHIKSGGTFVMLLHQADSPRSLKVIYEFHKFSSSVKLFKPIAAHAFRSSFYLVAKGVNPQSIDALHAVNQWKKDWTSCTLHGTVEEPQISDDHVRAILNDFGEEFIEMCEPIWKIQFDRLSRKLREWNKKLKKRHLSTQIEQIVSK